MSMISEMLSIKKSLGPLLVFMPMEMLSTKLFNLMLRVKYGWMDTIKQHTSLIH